MLPKAKAFLPPILTPATNSCTSVSFIVLSLALQAKKLFLPPRLPFVCTWNPQSTVSGIVSNCTVLAVSHQAVPVSAVAV